MNTPSKGTAAKAEPKAKTKPKAKTESVKTAKKNTADPLAMCPVDGAGWCPYPFSVAQLKKRLKAEAMQS